MPKWDTVYRPENVRFSKPPKALKNDRLVARMTMKSIRITEMRAMHTMVANSPFVTVSVGESKMFEKDEKDEDKEDQLIAEGSISISGAGGHKRKHKHKQRHWKPAYTPVFKQSTEINSLAGGSSEWDDLGYVMRIFGLIVYVYMFMCLYVYMFRLWILLCTVSLLSYFISSGALESHADLLPAISITTLA